MSDEALADTNKSLLEDHESPIKRTLDGEKKLRVFFSVNYCSRTAVYYQTYRAMDTISKYNRTVSKNLTKMLKRTKAQRKLHKFGIFETGSFLGIMKKFYTLIWYQEDSQFQKICDISKLNIFVKYTILNSITLI